MEATTLLEVPYHEILQRSGEEELRGAIEGDIGVCGDDEAENRRSLLVAKVGLHHRSRLAQTLGGLAVNICIRICVYVCLRT